MSEEWMEQEKEALAPVMEQLRTQSETLRQLEFEMMAAEDKYKQAQARFTEYATKTLPELYLSNGIDSLTLADGKTIRIATKTRASITKGADNGKSSKASIGEWLRQHGGENLISSTIVVDEQAKPMLNKVGIPYKEDMDINTNSLKAFVIGALGQSGSPATITMDDLPKGLSFYQWQQAEVV